MSEQANWPPGERLIAALPMYDWPEERDRCSAGWARCRDALRRHGVPAPQSLTRSNADLPPVTGGIRGAGGEIIAADPATLDADSLDVDVLWRHPDLLLAQTCWGPLQRGLAPHVHVLAQPDYSSSRGGDGIHYRSALVMRGNPGDDVPPPHDARALLPLRLLRGLHLARSRDDSMSGAMALSADLAARRIDEAALWASMTYSGSHRQSVVAVAGGIADVAAIDCRSFDLCRRHEPAARDVRVVGWTALRPGLPLVTSRSTPQEVVALMRRVLDDQPDLATA